MCFSKALCESPSSLLNARMYVGSYSQSHPIYPRPPYVLKQNDGQQSSVKNTYATYLCDTDVEKYIGLVGQLQGVVAEYNNVHGTHFSCDPEL